MKDLSSDASVLQGLFAVCNQITGINLLCSVKNSWEKCFLFTKAFDISE